MHREYARTVTGLVRCPMAQKMAEMTAAYRDAGTLPFPSIVVLACPIFCASEKLVRDHARREVGPLLRRRIGDGTHL